MMTLTQKSDGKSWKSQAYVIGAAVGSLVGFLSAYLYARAAEEDAERKGGRPSRIPTSQLLTLGLAALGLIRQITELGKPAKQK